MASRAAKVKKDIADLAKDWGLKQGYHGKQGGWIYPANSNHPVAQGWSGLYSKRKKEMLDSLTREFLVGFETFDALLTAPGGFRPTLRADKDWRLGVFADIYDIRQQLRGDPRRAFRG